MSHDVVSHLESKAQETLDDDEAPPFGGDPVPPFVQKANSSEPPPQTEDDQEGGVDEEEEEEEEEESDDVRVSFVKIVYLFLMFVMLLGCRDCVGSTFQVA